MKTLSILKKIILEILVLLALCAAVFFGANLKDEALTPAAQKMLQIPAPSVPDTSNGYFVLLGIDAPKDADALEAGMRFQATLEREYRENPARTKYSQAALPERGPDASEKLRCPLKGTDCVAAYLKNKPALLEWLKSEAEWRDRYARIMRMKEFEDRPTLSVNAPLTRYVPMVRAAEMNLVSAVFAIDAGDAVAGLNAIAEEIRLHRRLLAGSNMLIWKMINVSMLRRDYEVLSDVLEHWPGLAQLHAQLLAPILQPLDARESDMRRVFAMESLFAAHLTLHMRETVAASGGPGQSGLDIGWLGGTGERLLLQSSYLPHASLNAAEPYWTRRAEAGAGVAATAEARRHSLASYHAAWLEELHRQPWRYFRNPVGKILLVLGDDPNLFFNYAERVYDLDGYIRLVSLQAALRRDGIGAAAIAGYVQQATPALRNPYNSQAMGWDRATSSLWFEGRQAATANPASEAKVHRIKMAMT